MDRKVSSGLFIIAFASLVACSQTATPAGAVASADTTGGASPTPSSLVVWNCPATSCYYNDSGTSSAANTFIAGAVTYSTCRASQKDAINLNGDGFLACMQAFGSSSYVGAGSTGSSSISNCEPTATPCSAEGELTNLQGQLTLQFVQWECTSSCAYTTDPVDRGTVTYTACEAPDDVNDAQGGGLLACPIAYGADGFSNSANGPAFDCHPTPTPCVPGTIANVVAAR
jgi:hypothetical protein